MLCLPRYGLTVAARAPSLRARVPDVLTRLRFSAALHARRLPSPSCYSTTAPMFKADMSGADGHAEEHNAESQDVGTNPPQLKNEDSFSSTFYDDIKDITLDSQSAGNGEEGITVESEDSASSDVSEHDASVEEEKAEPPFVFTFEIPPPPPPPPPNVIRQTAPPMFWSHKLYRGPGEKTVQVEYCTTLEHAETVTQKFVGEPVLGFDMEWFPMATGNDIKMNASVMQLACEDKIAIFHIAQFEGDTIDELLPPTLKDILASADVLKTGVSILGADAPRLEKFFRLKPRGLFELSHMYNLVSGKRSSGGFVPKQIKKMADQVKEKLGLPLLKDSVRTSDWTRPLNQKQIDYAAADAYAGFMLYHVMNEERKQMRPGPPPRPEFAELKKAIIGVRGNDPAEDEDPSDISDSDADSNPRKKPADPAEELQGHTLALYEALCKRRTELADEKQKKPYTVATNTALKHVAIAQPKTFDELRKVRGIGEQGIRNYGTVWLSIVKRMASPDSQDSLEDEKELEEEDSLELQPASSNRTRTESRKSAQADFDYGPLFDALCAKRRELARQKGLPNYEIWKVSSNRALEGIARQRPKTLAELKKIDGMGDWKIRTYGEALLSAIRAFEALQEQKQDEEEQESSDEIMSDSSDDSLDITPDNLPPGAEGSLAGERILFTGILDILGRTAAQDLATKCGAEVLSGPDNQTTFVVTGRNVSATKLQTLHDYSLQTLSEDAFLDLIRRRAAARTAQQPLPTLAALIGGSSSTIASSSTSSTAATDAATGAQRDEPHRPLLNALTALRIVLSNASKLAPESICSDATLRAIALRRPRNRAELARVPGARMLDQTAQRCGKDVDELLRKHAGRSGGAVAQSAAVDDPARVPLPRSREGSSASEVDEGEEDVDAAFEAMDTTHVKGRSREDGPSFRADKETGAGPGSGSGSGSGRWVYEQVFPPASGGSRKRKF